MRAQAPYLLAAVLALFGCDDDASSRLEALCAHRGPVAHTAPPPRARCEGSTFVTSPPELAAALAGEDPEALRSVMRETGVAALYLGRERDSGASLKARFAEGETVKGFRTAAITGEGSLVVPYVEVQLTNAESDALARVARTVLGGTRPPSLHRFPPTLRAPRPVEIMVLIRRSGMPVFWRSARGSSLAAALTLALDVSTSRWEERQDALGGPLAPQLASLDVEVWSLTEDGTYATRARPRFAETLGPDFGVGVETSNGSWHYLLPEMRDDASGVATFERLFANIGFGADALERRDVRAYRLRAELLGRSLGTGRATGLDPGHRTPSLVELD